MSWGLRSMARAVGVMALVCAGCADGTGAVGAPPASGVTQQLWALARVDAARLPASIEVSPGVTRQILSGSMFLDADGTWVLRIDRHDLRGEVDLQESDTTTGRYSPDARYATTLSLVESDAVTRHEVTLTYGGTLEVTLEGHRYRFVPGQ